MNLLPLFIPGLSESAPAATSEISWPVTGQSDLFAALLQASLGTPKASPDEWPVPSGIDTWSQPQSTDADSAFLIDTDLPAPAASALSSKAGSAIASFNATRAQAWIALQDTVVSQLPAFEEIAPPSDPHTRLPVAAHDTDGGEVMRRIPIWITRDAAVRIAERQAPVDLEFDVAMPRPSPFAIPPELDIPDRPVPVPDAQTSDEPVRIPAAAVLPETRRTEKHPALRQAEMEVAPLRAITTEARTKTLTPPPRELIAEGSEPQTPRTTQHAPEVEALATASASYELHVARAQERGRVRPLGMAQASLQASRAVTTAALRAPGPMMAELQEAAAMAARQGHRESPSMSESIPSPDPQPGFAATANPDPGPGSLLDTQVAGRLQNLEQEAPVPVRFVLEDWTVGQPVRHVRMLLEPRELGGLRIFLRHNHQGIHARIVADRATALPHVEAGMSALKSVLAARGIQISSFSLTAVTAATAAGAAGLRPDGMPNGESAGAKQQTRSQGKDKRSGRTMRS